MLRTVVLIVLAVLLLAGCGATEPPTELTAGAPPEVQLVAHHGYVTTTEPGPATTTTMAPTTTTVAPEPSTTTTMPPSPPAPVVAPAPTGGCPAGGDPGVDACWHQLAGCESGGNWAANTGNGYYGGLQFALSSWQGVGGAGYPHQASVGEQISRARALWASGGWGHWPACTSKLGWR